LDGDGVLGRSKRREEERAGEVASRRRDPAIAAGTFSRGAAGLVAADMSVAMAMGWISAVTFAAARPHASRRRKGSLRRVGGGGEIGGEEAATVTGIWSGVRPIFFIPILFLGWTTSCVW
jgi:hypothetical protein